MSEEVVLGARERREEGQDEDGDGACQHHLNRILGQKEGDARDVAADVRGDMAGAHQHHHLDHLIILVVPLEQVDFGAVTDMEALMERTGGSCHHPAPSQHILPLTIDAPS